MDMKGPLRQNTEPVTLNTLARVASVAAGVQFGWALQLSLLTPYVQELGIPHTFASLIWLCGPVSGMVVQPIVGYYSDRYESSWGRRKPFIVMGSVVIATAVSLIGFSSDIGYVFGDSVAQRPRAIAVFVAGFWLLDLANNLQQGPSRALLADLSGKSQRLMRCSNGFFSFFMAVGNILGFASGSYSRWHELLSFTKTQACNVSCANLKAAFLISIILLTITTTISVSAAHEKRPSQIDAEENLICDNPEVKNVGATYADNEVCNCNLLRSFNSLPCAMWSLLLVTAATWIGWFPFLLFDTDWMGREVYGGMPSASAYTVSLYQRGVRVGAFGLMLNSVVLGATSLSIDFLSNKLGPKVLWALANFILCICLACIVVITFISRTYHQQFLSPPLGIKITALVLFAVSGAPLAVTYSLPFALAAAFSSQSETGQGVSMGALNLAIVIPQIIVSIGSGPLDQLLGQGSNVPAFIVASSSAFLGSIGALVLLHSPQN